MALREALSQGEDGLFRYSTIVWSDLKKTGKTTIAGAVAAWMAFRREGSLIRLVGNKLDQADSRVFGAIDKAVQLNPEWRQSVRRVQHRLYFPNGSLIQSVPVNPAGEAGGNDDMVEWTELWAATHDAHKQMWTEMTLSPTKFGQNFRWVDTYAGYSGESELLESLYQQGVKEGRRLDSDIEMYANDAARLFVLWNTRPRLGWLTKEYYSQEKASLQNDNEFRRLHGNEWVSSTESFIPIEWWDACRVEKMEALSSFPCVMALDAAVSDDCFGVLMLSRRDEYTQSEQGRVRRPILSVRYAQAHKPPKGRKLNYGPIEDEIRRLVSEYNVAEVCYDEFQLHEMCTRLQRECRTNFRPFPQGADRLVADKSLKDLIVRRQIEHQGESDLHDHVSNANAQAEGESKLRLVKRAQHLKIDLAVCLSMAADRILRLW